jgi:hypothetical protein
LIETLEKTKSKVNEVTKTLNLAERTRKELEESREVYRPVARHAALLYFALLRMSSINPMVRFFFSLKHLINMSRFSVSILVEFISSSFSTDIKNEEIHRSFSIDHRNID